MKKLDLLNTKETIKGGVNLISEKEIEDICKRGDEKEIRQLFNSFKIEDNIKNYMKKRNSMDTESLIIIVFIFVSFMFSLYFLRFN